MQVTDNTRGGHSLVYFGVSGIVLGLVMAHAQYVIKVGEIQTILLLPLTVSFLLLYSCRLMEAKVQRGLQKKKLKPTYGKGSSSRYMLGSLQGEIILKTLVATMGIFMGIYFLFSAILIKTGPLVDFIVSIDIAGFFTIVLVSFFKDQGIIKKR
ncbi:MAG: hypothetical protein ACTSUE_16155 [Promethearchaeota archaeon]